VAGTTFRVAYRLPPSENDMWQGYNRHILIKCTFLKRFGSLGNKVQALLVRRATCN
jgi:hypothetical protein